jgi:mono/diheme cytochrome c family protein
VCHGTEGKGNGPLASNLSKKPSDLSDHLKMSKRTDNELFRVIQGTATHAKINGAMPQWGLAIPGPQIKSLVAYIRFLHQSKEGAMGNPDTGAAIYANSCAACHGATGKGDGVMTNVLPMKPVDHTNAKKMNGMSNKELRRAVAEGAGDFMPGWSGILTDEEIDSTVGYIRLLGY